VIAGATDADSYSLVKTDIENFVQSLEFNASSNNQTGEIDLNSAEEESEY
jgi:hypothetical protein